MVWEGYMNDKAQNDRGISDALGAVVLISVVALGITIAVAAILSGPLPDRIPAMSVEVTKASNTVFIRHTGGDTLVSGEYRILVTNNNGRVSDFSSGGVIPEHWSVGETLEYQVPAGEEMPDSISIVAVTSKGNTIIQQVQV